MDILLYSIFKINFVFTIQFLALLLAIWFLAWAGKEQLNKWYRYTAGFVIVVISAIILCTAVNMFCHTCCQKGQKGCHDKYKKGKHEKCPHYHKWKDKKKGHHKKWKKKKHHDKEKSESHEERHEHPKAEKEEADTAAPAE